MLVFKRNASTQTLKSRAIPDNSPLFTDIKNNRIVHCLLNASMFIDPNKH